MKEVKKIWMDGELIDWHDAKVHILTHSLHYGGGVFEGIRAYKTSKGPAVFRLKEHIDRFFYSVGVLEMELGFSKEEIIQAVLDTIGANKVEECYIRPLAFFGYGKMGLSPQGAPVQVAVAVWPWSAYLGEKEAVDVKVSKYMRLHPKSTDTNAKICGHYANSILASLEVKRAGYDEALFLDYQGFVAEGPGENIFFVKDGELLTPSKENILAGITRDSIIKIAGDLGVGVEEKKITPQEAKAADEAFFTGTAVEVCPVAKIDEAVIGEGKTGEVTKRIEEVFEEAVRGQKQEYLSWLTFVS